MPSGGARSNAGRKKNFGGKSYNRRVPAGWTSADISEAVKARETVLKMRDIVKSNEFENDAILLQQLKVLLFSDEGLSV